MDKILSDLRSEEARLIELLAAVRQLIETYEHPKEHVKRTRIHGSETEFSKKMKGLDLKVDEMMFFPCDKNEMKLYRPRVMGTLARYSNGRKYQSHSTEGGFNVIRIL